MTSPFLSTLCTAVTWLKQLSTTAWAGMGVSEPCIMVTGSLHPSLHPLVGESGFLGTDHLSVHMGLWKRKTHSCPHSFDQPATGSVCPWNTGLWETWCSWGSLQPRETSVGMEEAAQKRFSCHSCHFLSTSLYAKKLRINLLSLSFKGDINVPKRFNGRHRAEEVKILQSDKEWLV